MGELAVAGLLLAHGLIHASYLSPRPPATAGGPAWPFELERSRLLAALGFRGAIPRPLGLALVALTVAGYALAAGALLGILPAGLWTGGIVAGSVASLALLGVFFHPWLVLGIVIDAVLLYGTLLAGWAPGALPI